MASSLAAAIFDMDGVVTRTAELHAAAWKAVFDEALRAWATAHGAAFRPFEETSDYLSYVDGSPREDGVRTFLSARGIDLPEGAAGDEPGTAMVRAVAKRKDALIVIGWHGSLVSGHAKIKRLLSAITCPMLLARAEPPGPSTLKVGDQMA